MDKKTLNNEIVSMRPDANRAKVHIISKLNREIKHLRVVKDFHSEAQKQKKLQKAERLVKEVLLMKKIKHDDISKFALHHTKHAMTAMLAIPSTSTEYRCLCRIGLHKSLLTRVEKLRTQFPNWEATLASLIASIGVKVKRHKVLAKQVELLQENKINADDDDGFKNDLDKIHSEEEFETGQDDGSDKTYSEEELNYEEDAASDKTRSEEECDIGKEEVDSSSNSDDHEFKPYANCKSVVKSSFQNKTKNNEDNQEVCDVKTKTNRLTRESKNNKITKQISKQIHEDITPRNDDDELSKDTQKTKRKTLSKLKKAGETNVSEEEVSKKPNDISRGKEVKKKVIANRSNEMKVMKFSCLLEADTTPTESLTVNNDDVSETMTSKSVDSFFVGGDGKSAFLSIVPLKEPTIEKPDNPPSQPVYDHLGRRLNRREIRASLHGKKSFKKFSSGFSNNSYSSKKWADPSTPLTFGRKEHVSNPQDKVLPPPPEEQLHPSWEAKKRQKEQLNTVFQGKKIKFDD